jgi:hypothetical protein
LTLRRADSLTIIIVPLFHPHLFCSTISAAAPEPAVDTSDLPVTVEPVGLAPHSAAPDVVLPDRVLSLGAFLAAQHQLHSPSVSPTILLPCLPQSESAAVQPLPLPTRFIKGSARAVSAPLQYLLCVDSGCTFSMSPFREDFKSLQSVSDTFVNMANGENIPVLGEGAVRLQLGKHVVREGGWLYVPGLSTRLKSVCLHRCLHPNAYFLATNDECLLGYLLSALMSMILMTVSSPAHPLHPQLPLILTILPSLVKPFPRPPGLRPPGLRPLLLVPVSAVILSLPSTLSPPALVLFLLNLFRTLLLLRFAALVLRNCTNCLGTVASLIGRSSNRHVRGVLLRTLENPHSPLAIC